MENEGQGYAPYRKVRRWLTNERNIWDITKLIISVITVPKQNTKGVAVCLEYCAPWYALTELPTELAGVQGI